MAKGRIWILLLLMVGWLYFFMITRICVSTFAKLIKNLFTSSFEVNKIVLFQQKTPRDSLSTARGICRFLLRLLSGAYLLSPLLFSVMLSSITYF